MRRFLAMIAVVSLVAAGCGAKSGAKPAPTAAPAPAPVQTSPPPTPAPVQPVPAQSPGVPALPSDSALRTLKLDELQSELEKYLNAEGTAPVRERLAVLLEHWGVRGRTGPVTTVPMAEADLNGDGTAELITALNTWGDRVSVPTGAVFVISRQNGRHRVDRSDSPPQPYVDGVFLLQASADLTRDGRPDIVWGAQDHGAHTAFVQVLVSQWQPGKVENLPGEMETSMAEARVEGQDVVLTGGTVGSAGAGMTQRAATFRYRWQEGAFTLADRRFDPSDWGYHRLVDGLNAEVFARTAEAEQYYRSALEPGRQALSADHVPPEWRERFSQAVRELSRVRLGRLLLQKGAAAAAGEVLAGAAGPYDGLAKAMAGAGGDLARSCKAATDWGIANPQMFEALGSPYGYNNYRWGVGEICGVGLPLQKR